MKSIFSFSCYAYSYWGAWGTGICLSIFMCLRIYLGYASRHKILDKHFITDTNEYNKRRPFSVGSAYPWAPMSMMSPYGKMIYSIMWIAFFILVVITIFLDKYCP
ncbi:hypothetical protein [Thiofilum flexile]|uniref:hypothetical protein n=1 Tax=Thiofilum flexile TaxID=125627 RepID=UPI00035E5D7F|nr:hypothetical protein [Thiofilum flexile]